MLEIVKPVGDITPELLEPAVIMGSSVKFEQFDNEILASLKVEVDAWEAPTGLLKAANKNNKWKIISSMQKAVRYCMPEEAMNAAHAGMMLDKAYVFRRLGIIAIEDVGTGDYKTCLQVLAAIKSVKDRQSIGDEMKIALYLAKKLAEAPKDRFNCEFCVMADFDRDFQKKVLWGTKSTKELTEIAAERKNSYPDRAIALWLMMGTQRFRGMTMPEDNPRTLNGIMDYAVNVSKAPWFILYMMHQTAQRLNEGMGSVIPLVWEHAAGWTQHTIKKFDPPKLEKKQGLLSSALDMHTREGKIAFALFRKKLPELEERFLKGMSRKDVDGLLGCGYFLAEGGILVNRLSYGLTEDLYKESHYMELELWGLPRERHAEFLQYLRDNIDFLNKQRDTALWMNSKNPPAAA